MKVKYTELAIASGKLNGTVHARNKSGNYIRKWSKPTNPKSAAQRNVRNRLASCTQAFANATIDEITGWNILAKSIVRKNRIGESVSNSGVALFSEFNCNRLKVGSTISYAVPVSKALPNVSISNFICTDTDMVLSLNSTSATAKIVVSCSPAVGVGVNNVNSKFKQVIVLNGSATTPLPVDIFGAYVSIFGMPGIGKKVFVKVQLVEPLYAITTQSSSSMAQIIP